LLRFKSGTQSIHFTNKKDFAFHYCRISIASSHHANYNRFHCWGFLLIKLLPFLQKYTGIKNFGNIQKAVPLTSRAQRKLCRVSPITFNTTFEYRSKCAGDVFPNFINARRLYWHRAEKGCCFCLLLQKVRERLTLDCIIFYGQKQFSQ
jgi:hypothetical protein